MFGGGTCLSKQNKWYESLHFFNKALKLDYENAQYWLSVAKAETRIGNVVSAVDAFEEASLLDQRNKEIWLDWSHIYYEQGEYDKAISFYNKAILIVQVNFQQLSCIQMKIL